MLPDAPEPIDTRVAIVTPENIAFEHRVAGPFRRLPAYAIDLAIEAAVLLLMFVILVVAFSLARLEGVGIGLFLIVLFVVGFFYHGLFEAFWNGQTPGKRFCGLRVVTVEGLPISPWQAILRNILRAADSLPLAPFPTYVAGLVASACNDRYQRLGDLVCGTMVIIEQPGARFAVTRIDDPAALALAELVPRSFRPSRTLAGALADYVARRRSLSVKQREEIARHVAEPLMRRWGLPPQTSPDTLACALYHRTFLTEEEAANDERRPDGPATRLAPAGAPGP